ncbi:MAG: polysaccharide deacetylase family protein [Crocinitomicaceae bacterium]|nr:polysaccharide deacetylase family protein [Crocinitomicaceae bacterium]
MLLIYAEKTTERLKYTLDFIFKERGINYEITCDKYHFLESKNNKLNYSNINFDYVLYIKPSNLIFDNQIQVYGLETGRFENVECLTFNNVVDPFSSIFYVLSRMEEYEPLYVDEHNRFESKNSVQKRFNWLDKAICDRWAEAIIQYLKRNKQLNQKTIKTNFKIKPTFDIDIAFAYKGKGIIRTSLSIMKDLLKRNQENIYKRRRVQSGKMIDPYNTYQKIYSIIEKGFDTTIFWLIGEYGKFDKNIHYKNHKQKQLIRLISSKTTVGLHPSYKSNSYEFHLLNEKERLESIIGKEVTKSRQHYLKLNFPITYQNLISMGIKEDYTMGYADQTGFRAGTARAHKWFDLLENKTTDLTIHPFVYMDGTLNEYLNLSIGESKNRIQELFEEVKTYGGDFSFIWHNSTIGGQGIWNGWEDVLDYTINLKSPHE